MASDSLVATLTVLFALAAAVMCDVAMDGVSTITNGSENPHTVGGVSLQPDSMTTVLEIKFEKQNSLQSSSHQQIMKEQNSAQRNTQQNPVKSIPQEQNPVQPIQQNQNPVQPIQQNQNPVQPIQQNQNPVQSIQQEQNHVEPVPQLQPIPLGQNLVQPIPQEQNSVEIKPLGQNPVQPVSSSHQQIMKEQNSAQRNTQQNPVKSIPQEQNPVQLIQQNQNPVQPIQQNQNPVQPIQQNQNPVQPIQQNQNPVQSIQQEQNHVEPVPQLQPIPLGQNLVQPIPQEQNSVEIKPLGRNPVQPVTSGQNLIQPIPQQQNSEQDVPQVQNPIETNDGTDQSRTVEIKGNEVVSHVTSGPQTDLILGILKGQKTKVSTENSKHVYQPTSYDKGMTPTQRQTDINIQDIKQLHNHMDATTQYFTTLQQFRNNLNNIPVDYRKLTTARKPFLALQPGPVIVTPMQINSVPDPVEKLLVSTSTLALSSSTFTTTVASLEEDNKDTLKSKDNFYEGLDLWDESDEDEFPTDDSQPSSAGSDDDDWDFLTGGKLIPKGEALDNSFRPSMESFGGEKGYPPPKEGVITSNLQNKNEDIDMKMDMIAYYSWILLITLIIISIFLFARQRHRFGYILKWGHSQKNYGHVSDAEEGKKLMKNVYT